MFTGTVARACFLLQCSPAIYSSGLPPSPLQEPVQGESPGFEAGMAGEGQLAGFLSDGANMIIRSTLLQVGLCLPPRAQQACLAAVLLHQHAVRSATAGAAAASIFLWAACLLVSSGLSSSLYSCGLSIASKMLPAVLVTRLCCPACRPPFSWPLRQRLASAQLRWLPTR